ncbi:MAG TPA: DUF92 domain-containing protein [Terriglobales bacterium]|nr:DUF92 domain-containing protein [Terriglobales bacterium]
MCLIANSLIIPSDAWQAASPARLAVILGITAAFALLGYLVAGVSRSGALAGAGVCFALFWGAGPGAFLGLLSVFGLTWVATRVGGAAKRSRGIAESGGGRTASQVLANIGVAAVCAAGYSLFREPWTLLGMVAALAEPAADTVSSECGQAFSARAFLITSFERVPAGTNGGVSLGGTLSGVMASLLVALVCVFGCGLPPSWIWQATAAGFAGMMADSVLGAAFERRGWLGNDAVNFLGTVVAVLAVLGLGRV